MKWTLKTTHFHRYENVAITEDCDKVIDRGGKGFSHFLREWVTQSAAIIVLALLTMGTIMMVFKEQQSFSFQSNGSLDLAVCTNPPLRREWRQLSKSEKLDYISAVQCLHMQPSRLNANDTLYDDFPRVHQNVGNFAHGAATFLSWHRNFIQIYETTLRQSCGYQGYLTYWDWSLDYKDPAKSVLFDSTLGFGGNGNANAPESVGNGHCVTEGPFAGLQGKYFADVVNNPSDEVLPHCLSRGFRDGNSFSGYKFRPQAMRKLFQQRSFDKFFLQLEFGPHNGIPQGIQGDFKTFTAPYDPLFFLHHTQVDRLWWLWQQLDNSSRMYDYSGRANGTRSGANGTATLQDMLPYYGLGRDTTVSEIMSTNSGILCYQY